MATTAKTPAKKSFLRRDDTLIQNNYKETLLLLKEELKTPRLVPYYDLATVTGKLSKTSAKLLLELGVVKRSEGKGQLKNYSWNSKDYPMVETKLVSDIIAKSREKAKIQIDKSNIKLGKIKKEEEKKSEVTRTIKKIGREIEENDFIFTKKQLFFVSPLILKETDTVKIDSVLLNDIGTLEFADLGGDDYKILLFRRNDNICVATVVKDNKELIFRIENKNLTII